MYQVEEVEGKVRTEHMFSYNLDYPPTAMDSYFSKLIVGVGHHLYLFDIYKQKLVERAMSDTLASPVSTIHVTGQKIFITQVM